MVNLGSQVSSRRSQDTQRYPLFCLSKTSTPPPPLQSFTVVISSPFDFTRSALVIDNLLTFYTNFQDLLLCVFTPAAFAYIRSLISRHVYFSSESNQQGKILRRYDGFLIYNEINILTNRLQETSRLVSDPVPGITAVPHEDNLRYFDVTIDGPTQSPYEGGVFKLELFLPEDYPSMF